jgi:hypothetical protein
MGQGLGLGLQNSYGFAAGQDEIERLLAQREYERVQRQALERQRQQDARQAVLDQRAATQFQWQADDRTRKLAHEAEDRQRTADDRTRALETDRLRKAGVDQLLSDPSVPGAIKGIVRARDLGLEGLPTDPHAWELSEVHAPHVEGESQRALARFRQEQSIRDEFAQAREARRPTLGTGPVTRQQRAQAIRDGRRDAIDYYNSLKDELGQVAEAVSLDDLVQEFQAEYLDALESGGDVGGNVQRGGARGPAVGAGLNLGAQPYLEGRIRGMLRPSGSGAGPQLSIRGRQAAAPAGHAGTITRTELAAVAQRLGITEQQAAEQARQRGLEVR